MAKAKAKQLTQELLDMAEQGREIRLTGESEITLQIINQICSILFSKDAAPKDVKSFFMPIFHYLDKVYDYKINFRKEKKPYITMIMEKNYPIECLKWFLERSANVNARDKEEGPNALFYAIKIKRELGDSIEAIKLLLKYKIDLNLDNGYNPVHALAYNDLSEKEKKEIILLLVDYGMPIDAAGYEKSSLLQAECEKRNNKDMVEFLLKLGANALLVNEKGVNSVEAAILGPRFSSAVNTDFQNLQAIIDNQPIEKKLEYIDKAISIAQNYKVHGPGAIFYLQEEKHILTDRLNLEEAVGQKTILNGNIISPTSLEVNLENNKLKINKI